MGSLDFLIRPRLITVFFVSASLHLVSLSLKLNVLSDISKPFLLLSLIVVVFDELNVLKPPYQLAVVCTFLALLFSLLGDTLLIYSKDRTHFFIYGLLSFLIAHLFYISTFVLSLKKDKWRIAKSNPYAFIGVLIYLISLLSLLLPNVDQALKPAILVYGVVISMMLLVSTSLYLAKRSLPSLMLVIGALLFVISDSIIAINKFYISIPFASLLIMSTYIVAQYFIVISLIDYLRSDE